MARSFRISPRNAIPLVLTLAAVAIGCGVAGGRAEAAALYAISSCERRAAVYNLGW